MPNKTFSMLAILLICMFISGCNTSLQVGDQVMGIQSGRFFFTDGTLRTQYKGAFFEETWEAAEKALQDMGALNIVKEKKISTGIIDAILGGENITITVEYVERDLTMVAVRIGVAGNNFASSLVHDKIKEHLMKKEMPGIGTTVPGGE
jgi:hypothetical protein